MNWKPNKWIALVLGAVGGPLGVLYAGYPALAALILVLMFVCGSIALVFAGAAVVANVVLIRGIFAIASMALCYVLASRAAARDRQPGYSRWYSLLAVFAAFVLLNVGIRVFLYEPMKAASSSMAPGADTGAGLIVQKWGFGRMRAYDADFGNSGSAAPVERGDIIVFDYPLDPTTAFVMRAVGVPGDTVVYRDRRLYINGADTRGRQLADYVQTEYMQTFSRFEEKIGNSVHQILISADDRKPPPPNDFAQKSNCSFSDAEITCLVPPGHYFVLGDNRDNSHDSRFWGFVPSASVVGKVVHISAPAQ